MRSFPRRMWVSQPSTHDFLHRYHGRRVIAVDDGRETLRVYFTEGAVISIRALREWLSEGWPEERRSHDDHS